MQARLRIALDGILCMYMICVFIIMYVDAYNFKQTMLYLSLDLSLSISLSLHIYIYIYNVRCNEHVYTTIVLHLVCLDSGLWDSNMEATLDKSNKHPTRSVREVASVRDSYRSSTGNKTAVPSPPTENHRWSRNPRPHPLKLSKLVFLICFD